MAKGSPRKSAVARRRRKERIRPSRATDTAAADTAAAAAAAAAAPPPAAPSEGSDVPALPAAAPLPVKKRRKVSEDNVPCAIAADDKVEVAMIAPAAAAKKSTKKSTKTGKTVNTYEPDVEMTKEQLAAWRREARRVRNRESAAASRRKTKDRIEELEKEVDEYKTKYEAALQKLAQYEGEGGVGAAV